MEHFWRVIPSAANKRTPLNSIIDSTVEFISPPHPGSLRVCNSAVSRRGQQAGPAAPLGPQGQPLPPEPRGTGQGEWGRCRCMMSSRGAAAGAEGDVGLARARQVEPWPVGPGGCSGGRKGSGPVATVCPAHLAPGPAVARAAVSPPAPPAPGAGAARG